MTEEQYRRKSDVDLGEIKTSLASINQTMTSIKEVQDKHDKIFFGEDQNEGGLLRDVSRLKDHRRNMETHTKVAWTAFIGLVIKTGWDALFHR